MEFMMGKPTVWFRNMNWSARNKMKVPVFIHIYIFHWSRYLFCRVR